MIRFAILDDHAVVRTGLKFMFKPLLDFELVLSTSDVEELFNFIVNDGAIDLLILDLHMPAANGYDVLRKIHKKHPHLKVLVFSMDDEHTAAFQAHRNGASAYINKQNNPDEIIQAAQQIVTGKRYFSLSQKSWLPEELEKVTTDSHLAHECLSRREFQIFQELVSGKSNKQIAESLAISTNTLSNHRAKILKKLRLQNNHELIRYALDHGYIK